MNDFKKLENENFHQYIWRLDGLIQSGKYKNWKEIVPLVNMELFGDDESQYRDELARAFSDEVAEARTLVAENQDFENMEYADKIIYCINLIDRLWEEKHGDEEVIIQLPPEEEVNYADINDLLDSIPQEETSVVFEDEGHRVK